MPKKTVVLKERSADLIEEAVKYFLVPRNMPDRTFAIGNRDRLELIFESIPAEMVVATYGTSLKCLVLLDYDYSDLDMLLDKFRPTKRMARA